MVAVLSRARALTNLPRAHAAGFTRDKNALSHVLQLVNMYKKHEEKKRSRPKIKSTDVDFE